MERIDDEPIPWEEFEVAFFDHLKEAKMMKFMNLKKGFMSAREQSLKLNNLSKYDPYLILTLEQECTSLY